MPCCSSITFINVRVSSKIKVAFLILIRQTSSRPIFCLDVTFNRAVSLLMVSCAIRGVLSSDVRDDCFYSGQYSFDQKISAASGCQVLVAALLSSAALSTFLVVFSGYLLLLGRVVI